MLNFDKNVYLCKKIDAAMNTIVVPKGIKGEDIVYLMGMCYTDINSTSEPDKNSPIMKAGNSIGGKKITGYLDIWGTPVLNVTVGNGKYCAHLKAKIDTGAYRNHINSAVAKQMNLISVGGERCNTPYGKREMPVYRLFFEFEDEPETCFVSDMPAIDYDEVEMLIGTQFITEFCDLHIYGKERKFELIFR
jgi:hypothetical protein